MRAKVPLASVVPFLNFEWFYDSRYDGWAQALTMLGSEVTVNLHCRYQVYLARQTDRQPTKSDLTPIGLNFMCYQ